MSLHLTLRNNLCAELMNGFSEIFLNVSTIDIIPIDCCADITRVLICGKNRQVMKDSMDALF